MTVRPYIKKIFSYIHSSLALLGTFVVILFILHELGLTKVSDSITHTNTLSKSKKDTLINKSSGQSWFNSAEWETIKIALKKDTEIIRRVSKELQIPPRMIIGPIIGEQTRFFTTNRAEFESYFGPVKKMINLTQFSYGIAGIKPETAVFVEENIKDPQSKFYLGKEFEHILDYPDIQNKDYARRERLNDETHYYSYIYSALIQKMLIAQWSASGIDISKNPGITATLYNIGFNLSRPHPNPEIGGVPITIDGKKYSFGELAEDFYWSQELIDEFGY